MMSLKQEGWHWDTLAVREAVERSQYGENAETLYLTSGFIQPDAQTAADWFSGKSFGYTYSRSTNPTLSSMEKRLAALEGTEAAVSTASGMGAILLLCMALLKAGDHVVCSRSVFGTTQKLIGDIFAKFGVLSTFVAQTDLKQWEQAMTPQTKLLFAETPTNPLTEVCDVAALAGLAHRHGALLTVDNSFCTPALQRPAQLGADLVMYSGTKGLDGQGRVMAGALCCTQQQYDTLFEPMLKCSGMSLSPFNAWVVLKGLETLKIRMQAQSQQALEMAQWLEAHPAVERVYYPGLTSHPQHELAMRQQNGLGGNVLSFVVRGDSVEAGRANAWKVIDHTQLCSISANVGDTKTIITHSASTTHCRLTEQARHDVGIVQGLIRLSVGLEDTIDIKNDLKRGLDLLL